MGVALAGFAIVSSQENEGTGVWFSVIYSFRGLFEGKEVFLDYCDLFKRSVGVAFI